MQDKSNFTPDEWKLLLLESVMMAGNRRLLFGPFERKFLA